MHNVWLFLTEGPRVLFTLELSYAQQWPVWWLEAVLILRWQGWPWAQAAGWPWWLAREWARWLRLAR